MFVSVDEYNDRVREPFEFIVWTGTRDAQITIFGVSLLISFLEEAMNAQMELPYKVRLSALRTVVGGNLKSLLGLSNKIEFIVLQFSERHVFFTVRKEKIKVNSSAGNRVEEVVASPNINSSNSVSPATVNNSLQQQPVHLFNPPRIHNPLVQQHIHKNNTTTYPVIQMKPRPMMLIEPVTIHVPEIIPASVSVFKPGEIICRIRAITSIIKPKPVMIHEPITLKIPYIAAISTSVIDPDAITSQAVIEIIEKDHTDIVVENQTKEIKDIVQLVQKASDIVADAQQVKNIRKQIEEEYDAIDNEIMSQAYPFLVSKPVIEYDVDKLIDSDVEETNYDRVSEPIFEDAEGESHSVRRFKWSIGEMQAMLADEGFTALTDEEKLVALKCERSGLTTYIRIMRDLKEGGIDLSKHADKPCTMAYRNKVLNQFNDFFKNSSSEEDTTEKLERNNSVVGQKKALNWTFGEVYSLFTDNTFNALTDEEKMKKLKCRKTSFRNYKNMIQYIKDNHIDINEHAKTPCSLTYFSQIVNTEKIIKTVVKQSESPENEYDFISRNNWQVTSDHSTSSEEDEIPLTVKYNKKYANRFKTTMTLGEMCKLLKDESFMKLSNKGKASFLNVKLHTSEQYLYVSRKFINSGLELEPYKDVLCMRNRIDKIIENDKRQRRKNEKQIDKVEAEERPENDDETTSNNYQPYQRKTKITLGEMCKLMKDDSFMKLTNPERVAFLDCNPGELPKYLHWTKRFINSGIELEPYKDVLCIHTRISKILENHKHRRNSEKIQTTNRQIDFIIENQNVFNNNSMDVEQKQSSNSNSNSSNTPPPSLHRKKSTILTIGQVWDFMSLFYNSTDKEKADIMGLKVKTVEFYLASIRKLQDSGFDVCDFKEHPCTEFIIHSILKGNASIKRNNDDEDTDTDVDNENDVDKTNKRKYNSAVQCLTDFLTSPKKCKF